MCITALRLAWLQDIRSQGYAVTWADALYEIEEAPTDDDYGD